MAIMDTLARWMGLPETKRSHPALPFETWVSLFGLDGLSFPTIRQTLQGTVEEIGPDFGGLAEGAFKRNGIIFACMTARQLLMSEARFQFQQLRGGVPGDLFGTEALAILERPWPNAQTSDLISRAVQDVDLAGNFFAVRRPNRIRRLRPDWMTIILGSESDPTADSTDIDAEVIGYAYHPGGYYSDADPVILMPNEVAHWAPIPDPQAAYRGMSWITPVIREVIGDSAARDHKVKFFENGATVNLAVSLDLDDPEKFKRLVEQMDSEYKGIANAYKTLYMAAGATPHVIGKDFQQMDFKTVQGAGEVRIAAAAGVHPVILGLNESLAGSSLNSGNFSAARRLTADRTLRPLWGGLAGALGTIVAVPSGSRLWYDDRHIPFLADDVKDAAEVQARQSSAIRQLVDGGFDPDKVVDAVVSGDLKRLVGNHTGLVSVQLLPPGTTAKDSSPEPSPDDGRSSISDLIHLAHMTRNAPQPVTLTIEDGAFRVETPVTVEPAQTHITYPEGFVRSETTVEPAQVTIEKGAVQVDSPITVEPGTVTIERGAVQVDSPVTVEPAQLTIEEGAFRSDSPVTVEPAQVTVNTPDVTIAEGAVRVDSPITVEPTQVTVEAPPAPEQRSRKVRKDIKHDTKGRITQIIETEEPD